MNKKRRQFLENIAIGLELSKSEVELAKEEEEGAYENLPESLKDGDKGDAMSGAIDNLDDAIGSIEEAIQSIYQSIEV